MDNGNGNGADMDDMSVTSAAEFRRMREQGEVITLPITNRRVRMRTVKPAELLRLGKIPDPLTELVMKVLFGPLSQDEYNAFFSLSERADHALAVTESLRVVCTAALLEPRIVDDPQAEDEIHIDDLEDIEQRFIFDLAMMAASELSRFRTRQAADVGPVPEGEGDKQPAEPVGGD